MFLRHIRILLLIVPLWTALAGMAVAAEKPEELDWSAWQSLPVFDNGRIMPLEAFARQTVDAVCDRQSPTLAVGESEPQKFSAAELLFSWLVEPERWEDVPFLAATDETLREDWLGVPVTDTPRPAPLCRCSATRFSRGGSASTTSTSRPIRSRGGRRISKPIGVPEGSGRGSSKKARKLYNAYVMYRLLANDPAGPAADRARFRNKLEDAASTWQRWQQHLQAVVAIQQQDTLTEQAEAAHDAIVRLAALASDAQASLGDLEPRPRRR